MIRSIYLAAIFALCSAASATAQTLRWSFTVPAPSYPRETTKVWLLACDGLGGAAFFASDSRPYPPESGITGTETLGSRILWVSRMGRLIHAIETPGAPVYPPTVTKLTPSLMIVRYAESSPTGAGTTHLQRFRLSGSRVILSEMILAPNQLLLEVPIPQTDALGFFLLRTAGESTIAVERYRN